MTSTNDRKDVKINQSSTQKDKSYYIGLYKSLDSQLNGDCELRARCSQLCEAWRRIHTLCLHSASSTHPHLLLWIQRHTARTVLLTEWQSPNSKDEQAKLTEAINDFIRECNDAIVARQYSHPWEAALLPRAECFKVLLADPWGHPVLRALLDPEGEQPTDREVLEWLRAERGLVFVARLRQLALSKCDDLALTLLGRVMDRARHDRPDHPPPHDTDDVAPKPPVATSEPTFESILLSEAGFSDIWDVLIDMEFVLLYKRDKRSQLIDLVKQTPLQHGYQIVERLLNRLESAPREKKIWKNAKEVAALITQVVIARCMVVPVCAGGVRFALYWMSRALVRVHSLERACRAAAALAAPAATARHLHTLAAAVHAHHSSTSKELSPFVVELYVRAITFGMNELEKLKLKPEKDLEARATEQTLASWFLQLGMLLASSPRMKCECTLTAFSVHPSQSMYDRIKKAPPLPQVEIPETKIEDVASTSEFGSWANDSRTMSNLVKTSETLNLKQLQQANVLSTAVLNEGEALGLSAELCQDIAVLLSGPRVKTLTWDMDRSLLLENCRIYMERTHEGTRALTTELKYLNIDPNNYLHLPEEDDDENDLYYGIEKGYEHLVEEQDPQPEEIWENAYNSVESEGPSWSDEDISSRKKKKGKTLLKYSSESDEDPLSLVAETKRSEKKKERPHSKERSTETKKKNKEAKKKEKKERKKKEKVKKSKKILGFGEDPLAPSDFDISATLTSPKCDENVVYDGHFSMDELTSPEGKIPENKSRCDKMKKQDNNKQSIVHDRAVQNDKLGPQSPIFKTGFVAEQLPSNEPEVADKACSPMREYPIHNNAMKSRQQVNEEVKKSISKLIQFRRQKALDSNSQLTLSAPSIPSPVLETFKAESVKPKNVKILGLKTHKTSSRNENETENIKVANSPLSPKYCLQRDEAVTNELNVKSAATSFIERSLSPALLRKYTEKQSSPHVGPKNTPATQSNLNNEKYQEKKLQQGSTCTTHLNSYQKFLEDLQKSANARLRVQESTGPIRPEKRKEMKPISRVTPVAVTPAAVTPAAVTAAAATVKAAAAAPVKAAAAAPVKDAEAAPVKAAATASVKAATAAPVKTAAAVAVKVATTAQVQAASTAQVKAATAAPIKDQKTQSAKSIVPLKKMENAPNTFARLSYMHKSKQNEKPKPPPVEPNLYHSICEELDRRVAEYKKIKAQSTVSYANVSNIIKPTPATNIQVSSERQMSPSLMSKRNPTLLNLLKANTEVTFKLPNETQSNLEHQKTQTVQKSDSALTEKDQQEIMDLLGQKKSFETHAKVICQNLDESYNAEIKKVQELTSVGLHYKVSKVPAATPYIDSRKPVTIVKKINVSPKVVSSMLPLISDSTILKTSEMVQNIRPQKKSSTVKPKRPAAIKINTKHVFNIVNSTQNLEPSKSISKKYAPKPPISAPKCEEEMEEQDWTKVMDALRAHKTPSRESSAIDMTIKNNSFGQSGNRNQNLKSNFNNPKVNSVPVISKISAIPIEITKAPSISDSTILKTSEMVQNIIRSKKVTVQPALKKTEPSIKKQTSTTAKISTLPNPLIIYPEVTKQALQKEQDPFISGIPDSDYEILEELMDDDLRQEIGELLSDEECYRTAPTKSVSKIIHTSPIKSSTIYDKTIDSGSGTNLQTKQVLNVVTPKLVLDLRHKTSEIKPASSNMPTQNASKLRIISNEKIDFHKLPESLNINSQQRTVTPTIRNPTTHINNNITNSQYANNEVVSASNVYYSTTPTPAVRNTLIIDPFGVYNMHQAITMCNSPVMTVLQPQYTVADSMINQNVSLPVVNVPTNQNVSLPVVNVPTVSSVQLGAVTQYLHVDESYHPVTENCKAPIQVVPNQKLAQCDTTANKVSNNSLLSKVEVNVISNRVTCDAHTPNSLFATTDNEIIKSHSNKNTTTTERKVLSEMQEKLQTLPLTTSENAETNHTFPKNTSPFSQAQSNESERATEVLDKLQASCFTMESVESKQTHLRTPKIIHKKEKKSEHTSSFKSEKMELHNEVLRPRIIVNEEKTKVLGTLQTPSITSQNTEIKYDILEVQRHESKKDTEVQEIVQTPLIAPEKTVLIHTKENEKKNERFELVEQTEIQEKLQTSSITVPEKTESTHTVPKNRELCFKNKKKEDVKDKERLEKKRQAIVNRECNFRSFYPPIPLKYTPINNKDTLLQIEQTEKSNETDYQIVHKVDDLPQGYKRIPESMNVNTTNINTSKENNVASVDPLSINNLNTLEVETGTVKSTKTVENIQNKLSKSIVTKCKSLREVKIKKSKDSNSTDKNIKKPIKKCDSLSTLSNRKSIRLSNKKVECAENKDKKTNHISVQSQKATECEQKIADNNEPASVQTVVENKKFESLDLDDTTQVSTISKTCNQENQISISDIKLVTDNPSQPFSKESYQQLTTSVVDLSSPEIIEVDGITSIFVKDKKLFMDSTVAQKTEESLTDVKKIVETDLKSQIQEVLKLDEVSKHKESESKALNQECSELVTKEGSIESMVTNRKPLNSETQEETTKSSQENNSLKIGNSSKTIAVGKLSKLVNDMESAINAITESTVNSPLIEDHSMHDNVISINDDSNFIETTVAASTTHCKIKSIKYSDVVITETVDKVTGARTDTKFTPKSVDKERPSNKTTSTNNNINANFVNATQDTKGKSTTANDIPQEYKDSVYFEEIPIPGNIDPYKKCVNVIMPGNNKKYRATIIGKMQVNFDTLFDDPNVKKILLSGFSRTTKYTLNVQQVSSTEKNIDPRIKSVEVGKHVSTISSPHVVDTVNLISDEEDCDDNSVLPLQEQQNQYIEFGDVKVNKNDLAIHKDRLFSKCFISLEKYVVKSAESSPNIQVVEESLFCNEDMKSFEDSEVIEIDDSSDDGDSFEIRNQQKIVELKNVLLDDLGMISADLNTTPASPIQKELPKRTRKSKYNKISNTRVKKLKRKMKSKSMSAEFKKLISNYDDSEHITKRKHNIKIPIVHPCFIKLVRCDGMLPKYYGIDRKQVVDCDQYEDSPESLRINGSSSFDLMDSYKLHEGNTGRKIITERASSPVVEVFEAINELSDLDLLGRNSPVMEVFDIISNLQKRVTKKPVDDHGKYQEEVQCTSEWLHTKNNLRKLHIVDAQQACNSSIIPKCVIDNVVYESFNHLADKTSGRALDFGKVDNSCGYVPSLVSIMSKYFEDNLLVLHLMPLLKRKRCEQKPRAVSLKRKLVQEITNTKVTELSTRCSKSLKSADLSYRPVKANIKSTSLMPVENKSTINTRNVIENSLSKSTIVSSTVKGSPIPLNYDEQIGDKTVPGHLLNSPIETINVEISGLPSDIRAGNDTCFDNDTPILVCTRTVPINTDVLVINNDSYFPEHKISLEVVDKTDVQVIQAENVAYSQIIPNESNEQSTCDEKSALVMASIAVCEKRKECSDKVIYVEEMSNETMVIGEPSKTVTLHQDIRKQNMLVEDSFTIMSKQSETVFENAIVQKGECQEYSETMITENTNKSCSESHNEEVTSTTSVNVDAPNVKDSLTDEMVEVQSTVSYETSEQLSPSLIETINDEYGYLLETSNIERTDSIINNTENFDKFSSIVSNNAEHVDPNGSEIKSLTVQADQSSSKQDRQTQPEVRSEQVDQFQSATSSEQLLQAQTILVTKHETGELVQPEIKFDQINRVEIVSRNNAEHVDPNESEIKSLTVQADQSSSKQDRQTQPEVRSEQVDQFQSATSSEQLLQAQTILVTKHETGELVQPEIKFDQISWVQTKTKCEAVETIKTKSTNKQINNVQKIENPENNDKIQPKTTLDQAETVSHILIETVPRKDNDKTEISLSSVDQLQSEARPEQLHQVQAETVYFSETKFDHFDQGKTDTKYEALEHIETELENENEEVDQVKKIEIISGEDNQPKIKTVCDQNDLVQTRSENNALLEIETSFEKVDKDQTKIDVDQTKKVFEEINQIQTETRDFQSQIIYEKVEKVKTQTEKVHPCDVTSKVDMPFEDMNISNENIDWVINDTEIAIEKTLDTERNSSPEIGLLEPFTNGNGTMGEVLTDDKFIQTDMYDNNNYDSVVSDSSKGVTGISGNVERSTFDENIEPVPSSEIENTVNLLSATVEVESKITSASEQAKDDKHDSLLKRVNVNLEMDDNFLNKTTVVYKDDSGAILKGIECNDPKFGPCFIFPVLNRNSSINMTNINNDIKIPVLTEIKVDRCLELNAANVLEDVHQKCCDQIVSHKNVKISFNKPQFTYSKFSLKRKSDMTEINFREKRPRRTSKSRDSSDTKTIERKYRKGKNIDIPKTTREKIVECAYAKEYKYMIDYISSVKFSYNMNYDLHGFEVHDLLNKWPIQGRVTNVHHEIQESCDLFVEERDNSPRDPMRLTLVEELNINYNDNDYTTDTCNTETPNFNKGFGERSGRVIQNLICGAIPKFSAATLSDVKHSQPLLLSGKGVDNNFKTGYEQQLETVDRFLSTIRLRNKVRSFFEKTAVELSRDSCKKEDSTYTCLFPFDSYSCNNIFPKSLEFIVHVVQVGQLPVSAAAQNPVTCDPRVTQVSDASPSQCSVVNSPHDDSQSDIKTEYTELTTADLSLPLVEDYVQHNQAIIGQQDSNEPVSNENIPIQTEHEKPEVKIELAKETDEKEKHITNNDCETKQANKNEYHYGTNNSMSYDSNDRTAFPKNDNSTYETDNGNSFETNNTFEANNSDTYQADNTNTYETNDTTSYKSSNNNAYEANENSAYQSNTNSYENTNSSSYETNHTYGTSNANSVETEMQALFGTEKSTTPEPITQRSLSGVAEKSDQIAHAMSAAGITASEPASNTRAHALVNLLSQKLRPGGLSSSDSSNAYPKAASSINAMALQQALAQILPPPLNQTNASDNNQQGQNITPQVLHIVQGKNASGNQITLVDNSQQSVISGPNATPVLHIVQNKAATSSSTANGSSVSQTNSFSGISLVDAGLQQGGNQLLHIVNTGNQKNNATGQLLKRVNLLTNLSNVQGSNEHKMVQFVCKSADGKAIQLNAPHQRSMVLRLQPIETPNMQSTQKPTDNQDLSPTQNSVNSAGKDSNTQEIKSRSVYEENYAKFIQSSSNKPTVLEKATSLPKFNQAFGKPVFQDDNQKQNEMSNNLPNVESSECNTDNAMSLDHISQISSPPLLLRKSPAQTSQASTNLVQHIKQTITPMNIQTMHGGVIYTRQIPVNIGGGQTINLITVPSTELIDDSGQKQLNQGDIEPSIIKIVPQSQPPSSTEINSDDIGGPGENNTQNPPQPQPVLTQMRIKLPMLSKAPQMVSGARVVRPSFFQIQRNVIGGTASGQPVYQQLVLTAAPPLGQQTIRLPQARQIKVPENQSSESQMSSSTLEQLREFDMVLEQVKERSTVQPSSSNFKVRTNSTDTTDSAVSSNSTPAETTQVLYSIGNSQPLNVAYVNRKASTSTPTTSTFVRSPDSSGIADSPSSSSTSNAQIPHTVTTESSSSETVTTPKPKSSSKSKSRPKSSSNPPMKLNTSPPKPSAQKPLEDEQTTQRILYILAEYKEQVENSPDKDKPAPRRRSNPPSNPGGSSKRKKSSSGSRRSGRDLSPVHGDDTCRTMGSEDSSCGTSQGDCNESCLESHSPQDSPRKVARKLTFEQDTPVSSQQRQQPQRNVIVADGQTITVARGTAGKPATAVLMPANYILPVSMVKGGQQIAIVTNRGPKLLTVGGGEGTTNALLLQRLIGPAGLKPVLTRPGVRHVRLPTAALHNLQAFNLTTANTVPPPDSTAAPATEGTPPDLEDTRAETSPWPDRGSEPGKPDRATSPDESEPWHLPADPHDYSYEETVRTDNMDRTVLDPIPDRYSPDMEAQRIFDKMFDVDSKKSYIVDSQVDSPRCAYDIDASDCDDKPYQVVQKKDISAQRQARLAHVSAAALRHKYAILEHELRLQKSLSEECEDLGVDSPSASELFPEAELLFAASPAQDHASETLHHPHTRNKTLNCAQPTILNQNAIQPDIDDQIATDQLIQRDGDAHRNADVNLGLEDVGIVTVNEDGMQATITLDQEEFARSHPNTTFHSEPTDEGEVQPFTISGLKSRHITSTIFHSTRAPATVLMTAPQATVISQATPETSNTQNNIKYAEIDMMNSMPSTHANNINMSSVLVKDDGLTRFDNILTDTRELHLSNTASAIVHSAGNATQVIRRVCYEDDKRERFLIDEPDALIAGDDAKMMAEDSRDATLDSMRGDVDDGNSSPERHAELFWESNSASERSEGRRPLDFSSDSEKCCKSPSYDETNSTDSSGVGTHMRLDSVIKDARGIERSASADGSSADDTHPPLRTYPPKRMYHNVESDVERSLSGKTRAGERSPDLEVRRRASGRGVVKRGCHCCNGSPAPQRPKKPKQRKPTIDFTTH